jgi:hypothetical protein
MTSQTISGALPLCDSLRAREVSVRRQPGAWAEAKRVRRRRRSATIRVANDERTGLCEALRNVHLDKLLLFLSVFPINLRSGREGVGRDPPSWPEDHG